MAEALAGLQQVAAAATLYGALGQLAMAQWDPERLEDDPDLLVALGLPFGRSPCVVTYSSSSRVVNKDVVPTRRD